jgi:hypothetical protein
MTIFNYEDVGDTNILNEKHGGTKRFFFSNYENYYIN